MHLWLRWKVAPLAAKPTSGQGVFEMDDACPFHLLREGEFFDLQQRRRSMQDRPRLERKLMMAITGWRVLLLGLLTLAASAQSPPQTGFISIDCGLGGDSNYTETLTKISYSPDEAYIDAGVNRRVSPGTNLSGIAPYYANVRSFPRGVRNCYALRPVVRGRKYLVRAEFLYGNYDGLDRPPIFDVYVGVNLATTVVVGQFNRLEVIAVALAESIHVCLVDTGGGTPFVSMLELRPLLDSMYPFANQSQSLLLLGNRENYGWRSQIRYPDDRYDRTWFPDDDRTAWKPIRSAAEVKMAAADEFQVPSAVLRTAVTAASLTDGINFSVGRLPQEETLVVLHFAELQQLAANETREFNVYADNVLAAGPYRPEYLKAGEISFTIPPSGTASVAYSIMATANSSLPPIFNAIEIYALQRLSLRPTDDRDAEAMAEIRKWFQVERNWVGDPCVPSNFTWEGLECSINATNYSRIISLNLSHSGLSGAIPPLIANLTALQSLDLSYNNFTGEIPAFLEKLPALSILNLASNNLMGPLPPILYEKSQNGSISLRVKNNPILCSTVNICETREKKRKIIVPIAIAISATLAIAFVILIIVYKVKRRKANDSQSKAKGSYAKNNGEDNSLHHESSKFSLSDIIRITNNFAQQIGRGGFGIVYLGHLEDETRVAVKVLSETSGQGAKEFRAEAQLLTRVHHKNLVSLLGYCNDNLSLVYEFMAKGSLADHLSGDKGSMDSLCWRERLRIATEAAQGLDYLHSGCKPSIVHRDVKPSNILLNQNLEAKLSDFGLSRAFSNEELTHISTAVAGTPGYLDPEYYQTYRLTEKSDIYSFGIVLLELLTGEPPIAGGSNAERIHIVQRVKSILERGDITSIADRRMKGRYDINSFWRAVEIAMSCTSPESTGRPTMSDVVVQLKECMSTEESPGASTDVSTNELNSFPIFTDPAIRPSAR